MTMFADPAFFRAVRAVVAPQLRTWPNANVWLLGTSSGADAYALAIALREEGLDGRVRVHGTDVDDGALRRAREAAYPADIIASAYADYKDGGGRASLNDYLLERGATVRVREELRRHVVFAQYSPETDASFAEQQLIVCRGALSSLQRTARQRAWRVLHESLCRFGVLAVSPAEGLDGNPCAGSYEALDAAHGLFRRGDA